MKQKEALSILVKAKKQPSKIKSSDIIIDVFTDEKSKCCAIGHIVRLNSDDPTDYSSQNCHNYDNNEGGKFRKASNFAMIKMGINHANSDISGVNNNKLCGYTNRTPKSRTIAFLNDAIKELS